MNHTVYRRLTDLAEQRGKEYGKLVQKLLAIAFCEAGATRITERSTQGIDLEVTLADGRRVALEVKTTQDGEVKLGKKDIDGLAAQQANGFEPHFALLGSGVLDEWIFARFWEGEIDPKRVYTLLELRAYKDGQLEATVGTTFAAAVLRHTALALRGGQGALDDILRSYACYATA